MLKPSLKDKRELQVIKAGVIASLNSSNFASVVESKEDYELWLKNLKRNSGNNLISTSFVLEIHKNSHSIWEKNKLIATIPIKCQINTKDIENVNDDAVVAELVNERLKQLVIANGINKYIFRNIPFGSLIFSPFR